MFTIGLGLIAVNGGSATSLTLDQYLQQVKESSSQFRSLELNQKAYLDAASEGSLVLWPQLKMNVHKRDSDFVSSTNPQPMLNAWGGRLELSERSPWGLDLKFSSSWERQTFGGTFADNPYHLITHRGEVSADLTQNFLGQQVRALSSQLRLAQEQLAALTDAQLRGLLKQAESLYYQCAAAQRISLRQQESLQRAQKLLDWNRRKNRLQLSDESSLRQAESNLARRRAALQVANSRKRLLAEQFNSLRQKSGSEIEALEDLPDDKSLIPLRLNESMKVHPEFIAERRRLEQLKAAATAGLSRNLPSVRAFAALEGVGEGLQGDAGRGWSRATHLKDPGYEIGVEVVLPLHLPHVWSAIRGFKHQREAADHGIIRNSFDQKFGWEDLQVRIAEAQRALELRVEMEGAETARLKSEQSLFDRGRSTTFLVIQAEEALAEAQISRIEGQAIVLDLLAEAKMYVEGTN